MASRRRTGSGSFARGAFASFWILLGCLSGLYLFNVLTDPTLGGQVFKPSPATSGETAGVAGSQPTGQDLTEIQESLRVLSQQVAALSNRLDGNETRDLRPPESPASAEPSAPTPLPAEPADRAEPSAPPQAPEVPNPAQAEVPEPAQPEAKPAEQAALDVNQSPPSAPEPAAAPEPSEPPAVAVSPLDELPAELLEQNNNQPEAATAPAGEQSAPPAPVSETAPTAPGPSAAPSSPGQEASSTASEPSEPAASPSPPPETETAALDPIALPPAANDGSTRYGIEIGVVAKQDGLRPLWREYLTNHAALVAGLQPRRVLAPDKKWRLIAGPFTSAEEASQACALFKKASRPCEATVYAGDSL